MKQENMNAKLDIPDKCSVNYHDFVLIVKGPKGELKRKIFHPSMNIILDKEALTLSFKNGSKREKTALFTYVAHLKNMFKGVIDGYTYKLKICSGHFPISATYKNGVFEVKNLFGETVPRKTNIRGDVKINISGNDIVVESIDKEIAGQAAATIEQLTRRVGFDRRRFQDGIYIVEKAGKLVEE